MRHFPDTHIVDCNVFIGHWAFRRLRHNDAAGILAMMDRFGIARACVCLLYTSDAARRRG